MAATVDVEGDYLRTLINERDKAGLNVSCWTVCLHNTRLGIYHPQHVMRKAQGDPHIYALCPSSNAARSYLTTMVKEITHTYRPNRLELESPGFMGFSHGFHHEKDGLGLLPEDEFLLGVCFCQHCIRRARFAGVPASDAQKIAAQLLDRAMTRELPSAQFPEFSVLCIEVFARLPELYAYLQWRCEPVTSLIAEVKSAAHPDTKLLLLDAVGSWAGGVDLKQLMPHLDGILHCSYFTPVEDIHQLMSETRLLVGPDKTDSRVPTFHPNVKDRNDLETRAAQAAPVVDGMNFCNLGLVPDARLDWIRTAVS